MVALLWLAPAAAGQNRACPGGLVGEITIENHSVFDLADEDSQGRLRWAYRLANRLHVATRPEVIRRELLFEAGDCHDPRLLAESERVLRTAPFIADAEITSLRRPDGSHHVTVTTRDEWSLRVEGRLESGGGTKITGFSVQEQNLMGTGRQVAAFYRERFGEETYGVSFATPQLLSSRLRLRGEVGKTQVGFLAGGSLAYPFTGPTGRWAYRLEARHHDRFFEFIARGDSGLVSVLFPERRRSLNAGAVRRFGSLERQTFLGAGISTEWIAYPDSARLSPGTPPVPGYGDLLDTLSLGMDSIASVRALLLAGQRNIRYVRRRGFDAVRGMEDVRLGAEAAFGLGRSVRAFSSGDDISAELGLFAAGEPFSGLMNGFRLFVEGKRNYDTPPESPEWQDVFTQAEAWAYWRPSSDSRHTWTVSARAMGGWNTRVPFQLTLGGGAGMRGRPRHLHPAGQRAVFSLEQRSYLGWPFPHLFDLGGVVFVDLGRAWAGDVPYGTDSPWEVDAGLGLRLAFPPGSRRTYRLDVGFPLTGGGSPVFTVGTEQAIGRRPAEAPQMWRSSRRTLTTSDFVYPDDLSDPDR